MIIFLTLPIESVMVEKTSVWDTGPLCHSGHNSLLSPVFSSYPFINHPASKNEQLCKVHTECPRQDSNLGQQIHLGTLITVPEMQWNRKIPERILTKDEVASRHSHNLGFWVICSPDTWYIFLHNQVKHSSFMSGQENSRCTLTRFYFEKLKCLACTHEYTVTQMHVMHPTGALHIIT